MPRGQFSGRLFPSHEVEVADKNFEHGICPPPGGRHQGLGVQQAGGKRRDVSPAGDLANVARPVSVMIARLLGKCSQAIKTPVVETPPGATSAPMKKASA